MDNQRYVDLLPLYLKKNLLKSYLTSFGDVTMTFRDQLLDFWRHINPANIKLDGYLPKYSSLLTQIGLWFGYSREFGVGATSVVLSDRHLERLIRTRLWSIGYDGTREMLEANVKAIFGNEMKLTIHTIQTASAEVEVLLTYSTSLGWDTTDDLLWENGYYINSSVGITYTLTAVPDDTLIYDVDAAYDDAMKYDGVTV